jgi:hypothetical protein
MLFRARFMIDVDRRIVFSYMQEDFSYADALGHIERLGRDPQFHPDFRQIIDLRDVADPQISADQVRALARHNVFNPDSRRAMVAPSDASFGLARIFDSIRELRGETGIRVVRNLREGVEWVEIALTQAEAALAALRSAERSDR